MERQNLRALVAGDNQAMRSVLASVLTGLKIGSVRQALDGGDAFRMICEKTPDFVVLDFEQDKDTIAAVRAIRRSPDTPRYDLPIVATVAVATRSNIELLMREGADRILLKPVKTSALDSCIEYFLRNERKLVLTPAYAGRERRLFAQTGAATPQRREDDPNDILDLDVA